MNLHAAHLPSSETRALLRAVEATAAGPIASWPQGLRAAACMVLCSGLPLGLAVGPDASSAVMLYNDAFIPFLGRKHPEAMGQRIRDVWPEIWDFLEWALRQVWQTGCPVTGKDLLLCVDRSGQIEEVYATLSISAICDDREGVCGTLICTIETTAQVIAERRQRVLRAIAEGLSETRTEAELCLSIQAALAADSKDLPFTLLYLLDAEGHKLVLRAHTGLPPGTPESPNEVDLRCPSPDEPWQLARVVGSLEPALVTRAEGPPLERVPTLELPQSVFVIPVMRAGQDRSLGVLVAGIHPLRLVDAACRAFVQRLAREIGATISSVRAFQEARRRADALAELDRVKTTFLSNISHELRTPLTLVIGPIEDMLSRADEPISSQGRETLGGVRRNAYRMLRQVNSLLEFARLEAGRTSIVYEPTDLATFTREVASGFDSAAKAAGLRLILDCPPMVEPVFVARDMWEQIVLNLLSNAFKFTFEGEVALRLSCEGPVVRLTARDTGVGIPAEALPHLFERFYRVPNARARTHEGMGIGLALVRELVKLHGGSVRVSSAPGQGSTFTVEIPRGSEHLPPERVRAAPISASVPRGVTPFMEDVMDWLEEPRAAAPTPRRREAQPGPMPRILVVDDCASMRSYLTHLLEQSYEVEALPDGQSALVSAQARVPDLVLSDVVMPGMDGCELLRALRADPKTREVPVVLVSGRGGEEATVQALAKGADDYLVKPFTASELSARVRAHLELARGRRDAAESRFKDTFLQIASHELRTPLTSLMLNIELLQRRLTGISPVLHANLAAMRRSLDRMARLLEDMLTVSALKEGELPMHKTRCDLVAVCRAASEQMLLSGRLLSFRLPRQPLVIEADAERIGLVVMNLVSNALKYSPPDKPVTLALHESAPGEATVTVQDKGPGIAADELCLIFDRFYRAPNVDVKMGSQVGLGLGLFIAKKIVLQHGGRIWAVSEPGKGSAFSFSLPLLHGSEQVDDGAPKACAAAGDHARPRDRLPALAPDSGD